MYHLSQFSSFNQKTQMLALITLCFSHREYFTLDDVYELVLPIMSNFHPQNNTMKAKLRFLLQSLRDDNRVKFMSPGKYQFVKKLVTSKVPL